MIWSPQQEESIKRVRAWLKDPYGKQVFRLFGFAGTGKTSIGLEMSKQAKGTVLFASFTGKAAMVMRTKGMDGASTIHSLIYRPIEDNYGVTTFVLDKMSPLKDAALLIVDEVSMVNADIARDLMSFGVKILVLGDPAQLPPVEGAGYFTHGPESTPDMMLTEIHRQAQDNPIIRLATMARMGETIEFGEYGESSVISGKEFSFELAMNADQCIVGKNVTRHLWNRRMREIKGLRPDRPVKGDRLVCLKNNRLRGLLNGGIWTAEKVGKEGDAYNIWVKSVDEPWRDDVLAVKVRGEFFVGDEARLSRDDRKFHDEFTFAYALTCHKCQGSQWDSVLIYDQSDVFREDKNRWMYTAITRAAKKLVIAK